MTLAPGLDQYSLATASAGVPVTPTPIQQGGVTGGRFLPVVGAGRHGHEPELRQQQPRQAPAVATAGVDAEDPVAVDQGLAVTPVIEMAHDQWFGPVVQFVPGPVVVLAEVVLPRQGADEDRIPLAFQGHPGLPEA